MSSSSSGSQPQWQRLPPSRKDCSDGTCSTFCPQWCDIFAAPPPPPPSFLAAGSGDDSSSPALSPLVIAIIGVVAAALLLVAYYTIISRYCGGFSSFWSRALGYSGSSTHGRRRSRRAGGGGQSHQPESWNAGGQQLSDGLEQGLINKITVCRYKRGDGFVEGTDCPVCLGEFRDGESLRVLPKCSHAFHIPCIDTWLKSHSNCPLCRCNIAPAAILAGAAPEPREEDVVVVIDGILPVVCEEEDGQEVQKDDEGEVEEEIAAAARKQGLLASSIGSSRQPDGRVVRSLHCVAYPPEIKRVSAMLATVSQTSPS